MDASEFRGVSGVGTTTAKDEAAGGRRYTRIAVSTLAKLRCYGGGPPYSKVASRVVIYDKADLDTWLATQLRWSTSSPVLDADNCKKV